MRWTTGVLVFVLLIAAGAVVVGVVSRLPHHDVVLPPPPKVAALAPLPPAGDRLAGGAYTTPETAYGSVAGEVERMHALGQRRRHRRRRSQARPCRLCVRRGGGYPYAGSIVLGDTHGQFACADCALTARFDGRAAPSFDATAASTDGTDYSLSIRDGPRLAAELKRGANAVDLYGSSSGGAGAQKVTFDVAGLRWGG